MLVCIVFRLIHTPFDPVRRRILSILNWRESGDEWRMMCTRLLHLSVFERFSFGSFHHFRCFVSSCACNCPKMIANAHSIVNNTTINLATLDSFVFFFFFFFIYLLLLFITSISICVANDGQNAPMKEGADKCILHIWRRRSTKYVCRDKEEKITKNVDKWKWMRDHKVAYRCREKCMPLVANVQHMFRTHATHNVCGRVSRQPPTQKRKTKKGKKWTLENGKHTDHMELTKRNEWKRVNWYWACRKSYW